MVFCIGKRITCSAGVGERPTEDSMAAAEIVAMETEDSTTPGEDTGDEPVARGHEKVTVEEGEEHEAMDTSTGVEDGAVVVGGEEAETTQGSGEIGAGSGAVGEAGVGLNDDGGNTGPNMEAEAEEPETGGDGSTVAEETNLTEEDLLGENSKKFTHPKAKANVLIEKLGYKSMSLRIFQKMRDTFGSEECEYCGRLFFSRMDYEPHVRTHTGEDNRNL